MSYILDALRKADAQRERDPARGIHAQPLHAAGERRPRSGYAPWVWGASLAGVTAVAGAGWLVYQEKATVAAPPPARVEIAAQSRAPVAVAAAPAPAPVVGTAVRPPPPALVTVPPRDLRMTSQPTMRGGPQPAPGASPAPATPAVPGAIVPPPAVPASATAPVPAPGTEMPAAATPAPAPTQSAAPPFVPAPPTTPMAPTMRPTTPAQSAAAAAAAAPAAAPVAGLPPDAPKLAISGGVYSTNPAQRMLIVNGQVFNEGSEIGPGVVLEQIKSKGAVLRFRNARYTVTY